MKGKLHVTFEGPGNDNIIPVGQNEALVNSNYGRKPHGTIAAEHIGVNSQKAQQNNEPGRVQSKANKKESGK